MIHTSNIDHLEIEMKSLNVKLEKAFAFEKESNYTKITDILKEVHKKIQRVQLNAFPSQIQAGIADLSYTLKNITTEINDLNSAKIRSIIEKINSIIKLSHLHLSKNNTPQQLALARVPTIDVPTQQAITALFPEDISLLVLQYFGIVPKEILQKLDCMANISKAITAKLGKPTAQAVTAKICTYIDRHIAHWVREISQTHRNLYIPASEECPRSLQFNTNNTLFIHFNSQKKGDPLIGKGANKTVKYALDCCTLKWYASSGIDNRRGIGNEEIEAFEKVKGIEGVIQLSYAVNYRNKGKHKTRLITPLYSNGTLMEACQKPMSEEMKGNIFSQLIRTVTKIHSFGLLHRDLKPENIFLGDVGDAVIGDIGSICRMDDFASKMKHCSSSWWASPEYARALTSNPQLLAATTTPKHDIWALGCVLFDVARGVKKTMYTNLPWAYCERATYAILSDLQDSYTLFPEPTDKNSYLHILWEMLRVDPQDRISSEKLAARIEEE